MLQKLSLQPRRIQWIVSVLLLVIAIFCWLKPQSLGWLFADESADRFFKQSMLVTILYLLFK
mgnify:CR=1 FL=1